MNGLKGVLIVGLITSLSSALAYSGGRKAGERDGYRRGATDMFAIGALGAPPSDELKNLITETGRERASGNN